MNTTTTRRKPALAPTPRAADAMALGMTIIEAAVAHYWAVKARRHEGYRRYESAEAAMDAAGFSKEARYAASKVWESWMGILTDEHSRATATLLRAILTWHGHSWLDVTRDARPKAVIVGGKAYIATPDPQDLDGEDLEGVAAGPEGVDHMHLVIMPAGAIADLDEIGGVS